MQLQTFFLADPKCKYFSRIDAHAVGCLKTNRAHREFDMLSAPGLILGHSLFESGAVALDTLLVQP